MTSLNFTPFQKNDMPKKLSNDYSKNIKSKLMASDKVKKCVLELSEELHTQKPYKFKTLENAQRYTWNQVNKVIESMMAQMDHQRLLRFTAVAIEAILTRIYDKGIFIKPKEVELLKEIAAKAKREKKSLVILPSHKSHIDYLVIRLGIDLPHVAAGDNLNIPLVGTVLRNAGAFFIRRQWGNDSFYGLIMKEYIQLLLKEGHHVEAFIEGGRSRIGKLLQPKFGILKIIIDSVYSGEVEDAIIVPISIGYDKVIETSTYIDELLGGKKEKESLTQLISNINLLSLHFGGIYVSVASPFSLRDYLYKRSSSRDDATLMALFLGFKILGDINSASIIMPTALVGTILLTLRGRGVGSEELVRKFNGLKERILRKGARVAEFGSVSTFTIVEKATHVLHDLIGKHSNLMEFVYFPKKRFELSYYRNQIIHLFIAESVISAALYCTIKVGGSYADQRVQIDPTLIEDASFLSSLLKYEFIFNTGGLQTNLLNTLDEMVKDNILSIEQESGEPGQGAFVRPRKQYVRLTDEERRIGRENFDFYCFLIWPFIETYWLASMCIFSLIPESCVGLSEKGPWKLDKSAWISEKVYLDRCQFFAKTLYYEGDLSYFESINKETLKNAFTRFIDMGVLVKSNSDTPPLEIQDENTISENASLNENKPKKTTSDLWIAIHPSWLPKEPMPTMFVDSNPADKSTKAPGLENEQRDSTSVWYYYKPNGKLWELCENISRFRREGKNRRDTATVSSRVLRLCRLTHYWNFDASGRKVPVYVGPKL